MPFHTKDRNKLKTLVFWADQKTRQAECIARQQANRRKVLNAKRLAVSTLRDTYKNNSMDENIQNTNYNYDYNNINNNEIQNMNQDNNNNFNEKGKIQQNKKKQRKKQRKIHVDHDVLMHGEWMLSIPTDFPAWQCIVRVEGYRCVVISGFGRTAARDQHGRMLFHQFPSALPNGNSLNVSDSSYTILDCIYSACDKTFYVLDVICWKSYDLDQSTFEFRSFWLQSKLGELNHLSITRPKTNVFKFIMLPRFPCNKYGIQKAYHTDIRSLHKPQQPLEDNVQEAQMDGLYFYHKRCMYTPGITTLMLLWKDSYSCRYLDDQVNRIMNAGKMAITVELGDDDHVRTCDQLENGISLGLISKEDIDQHNLYPGALVKCSVESPAGDGLQIISRVPSKFRPDSITKLLFFFHKISCPEKTITIETLLNAVSETQTVSASSTFVSVHNNDSVVEDSNATICISNVNNNNNNVLEDQEMVDSNNDN